MTRSSRQASTRPPWRSTLLVQRPSSATSLHASPFPPPAPIRHQSSRSPMAVEPTPDPPPAPADLARRVYLASHLTGTFVLRSGATSSEYFDKYRFESD